MDYQLSPKSGVDASTAMYMMQVTGLRAAEDIPAGHPARIGAGRKVYKAKDGDKFDGVTPRPCKAGEAITIYGVGVRFRATDTELDPEKLYKLGTAYGVFVDTAPTDVGAVLRPVGRFDLEVIRVGATVAGGQGTVGNSQNPTPGQSTGPTALVAGQTVTATQGQQFTIAAAPAGQMNKITAVAVEK